jgi:hypothetical protein
MEGIGEDEGDSLKWSRLKKLGLLKKNVSDDSSPEGSTLGRSGNKLDAYKGGNND